MPNLMDQLRDVALDDLGVFTGKIRYYDEVDSTNNLAKKFAEEGADEGTIVVAEMQTQGRGRLERVWFSEMSAGLCLTMILRPNLPPNRLCGLTLLAAVAVAETLDQVLKKVDRTVPVSVDIKWPNDILLNGKKACGVLSEMGIKGNAVSYVVIGIGININNAQFPSALNGVATSLFQETGTAFQRSEIFQLLLKRFDAWYNKFSARQFNEVYDRWCQLSSYAYGKRVGLECHGKELIGITRGLSPDGALLIERDGGAIEPVFAADIHAA